MGLVAAGLGVAAGFGPNWGAGAPAHPAAFVTSAPAAPPPIPPHPADQAEWQSFRQRFITPEGRVVDTGNGNVSHSEGQGWGLFIAQACDDPAGFARLLEWTTRTLQCRPYDGLHAWRYRPADATPVADLNNATDGDLYIAAALARAAQRWNRPDYAQAARRVAQGILGLVRQAGPRTILLPGAVGFETATAIIVNPSYYTYALFPSLPAVAPSPLWDRLRQDGLALALQGRFGAWRLPPDWLRVDRQDGTLRPAAGWPPRFSYDAIRVPLHLAWGGLAATPLFDSFGRYWAARPVPPAWADLTNGETAPYPAPAGFHAVAGVVAATQRRAPVTIPPINLARDYYSAGLVLLARLAMREALAA